MNAKMRKNFFRSIAEFEREYLPENYKLRITKKPGEEVTPGLAIAHELGRAIQKTDNKNK